MSSSPLTPLFLHVVAKEQLEYFQIHEDFQDIKAESINNVKDDFG